MGMFSDEWEHNVKSLKQTIKLLIVKICKDRDEVVIYTEDDKYYMEELYKWASTVYTNLLKNGSMDEECRQLDKVVDELGFNETSWLYKDMIDKEVVDEQ